MLPPNFAQINYFPTTSSNSPVTDILKNGTMRFELDYIQNCSSNYPMSPGIMKFNVEIYPSLRHKGI